MEVVPITSEWAFARTESAGKQTIHAISKTTDEANQVRHRTPETVVVARVPLLSSFHLTPFNSPCS